ncbi:MAG TPA: polysaccharide deacetylase family protein [Actinomycetales bacterium]|nr:polysaccharide deacetylase family protein [Actinomycetales bacterium]
MSQRQGERGLSSLARAVGTACAVVLVGALVLVGGQDVTARGDQPEASANSLFGSSPGDPFGTVPPRGAARGSDLPGLEAPPLPGHDAPPAAARPTAPPRQVVPSSDPTMSSSRVLYLTFDDGPDPTWTPRVLALLRQYGVHATFFELGVQVREHPTLPSLVLADGHRIGNHTYGHKRLTSLDAAQLRSQIRGGPHATCLRPPFGAVDARVRRAAAAAGQRIVLWDVDTRDWSKPGTSHIVQSVLKNVHPGATILMHDAGGDRSETIAALRVVLPRLVAEGYTFATVPGC